MVEYNKEDNRPVGYVVAGTPGEPTIPAGPMLNYVGLVGKYVLGSRYGYDFLEIDMWNDAEALEPGIKTKFKRIRETQKIDCGMHLKIHLDLTSSLAERYNNDHQSLLVGVQAAALLAEAKFILIHSASSIVPEFTDAGRRTESAPLVTPWGGSLGEFIRNPLKFDKDAWKKLSETSRDSGSIINKIRSVDKDVCWNIFCNVDYDIKDDLKIEPHEGFGNLHNDNISSPTLMDWAIANYMTPFWSPIGTIEDPSMKVELKKHQTMYNLFWKVYNNHIKVLENLMNEADINIKKIAEEVNRKIEEGNLSPEEKKVEIIKGQICNLVINEFKKYRKFHDIFKKESNNNIFERINGISGFYFGLEHTLEEIKNIISQSQIPGGNEINEQLEKLRMKYNELRNNNDGLYGYHGIIRNVKKAYTSNYKFWESGGSAQEEKMAYHVIAKWMYITKDPLYEYIVAEKYSGAGENEAAEDGEVHKYFALLKKEKDKEWWINTFRNGIKKKEDMTFEMFIDPDNIIKLSEALNGEPHIALKKMVSAVAGKYIQGHFDQRIMPVDNIDMELSGVEKSKYIDAGRNPNIAAQEDIIKKMKGERKGDVNVYEYLYKSKIHFYIETQTKLNDGMEGKVKIMRIIDHINIIRAFNKHYRFKNISYTLDFEHLTLNLLNPEEQINMLKSGDGKYVSMVHINPPSSHDGLHKMLGVLTEDIEKIYRWVWMLKEKGMDNAFFVWEMGKDSTRNLEAPIALRKIKEYLNKNIKYDDLYKEENKGFFGIDKNFEAAQNIAISAHALDPLKDMFVLPEPDHGFMGQSILASGRSDKIGTLEKEKHR